ncbi:carbamoyltransferase HypF [Bacillus massiliigorillae]|uniref:carbamoyltransferase HypF n=1 Tax=Bacillus massiliigorillae TaxID=1243664 RepID=UPI00039FA2CA|nr:carbamoyltransferase HypF [Bacillus massiliigorillae]
MCQAINMIVRGRVQGVGFRPFVFQLAERLHLHGTIQNNMNGVEIHLEGPQAVLEQFVVLLEKEAPRLSRIEEVIVEEAEPRGFDQFSIIESERTGASQLIIPMDVAVCEDCLEEMNNPNDRRYAYPFINCTQCGPRYTIIKELPYDRIYTSMASFAFCEDCEKEYNDPYNRRHHAQPIACPVCGPRVSLVDCQNQAIATEDVFTTVNDLLLQGKIIAVKGLGGYHLCCDARNEVAVASLRERKKRPNRPLAVMSQSIEEMKSFAKISEQEESLLKSPEAPIVVLQKNSKYNLADSVASKMSTIGVMLPYTPLHHLLLQHDELQTLVMTSANTSGLPMNYRDDEALQNLAHIADYFLVHNREILHPVDDSVVQIVENQKDFFRRSRGYAPDPLTTKKNVDGIIALGGQQKATFAIGRGHQVFVGPYIGELDTIETIEHYQNELTHLMKWVAPSLRTAVIDYHPGYQARQIVKEYDFQEVIEVQHHHAHMAACMADNNIEDQTFAIILDGTGFGLDGHIWGFEILHGDARDFTRLAHLTYTPLPGAEKCIREPWRNAVSMLMHLLGEEGKQYCEALFPCNRAAFPVLQAMMEKNMNTVYAGTCGRLFDAVSAITGVCMNASYDGEAAILLSELADCSLELKPYSFEIHEQDELLFDFTQMLKEIVEDVLSQRDVREISTAFHETIVCAIVQAMSRLQSTSDLQKRVVLSGGSFHNRYLIERLTKTLSELGFEVYSHRDIPCNDGGLSYGQLMVASAKRGKEKCV